MTAVRNISIRQRLTSIIVLASFTAVMLTTLSITVISYLNLRASMLDEISVSASIVGDRNTAALLFNDDQLADTNLKVFSVKRSILQACLYNQAGEVFARYTVEDYAGADCPKELKERLQFTQETLEVMKPIVRMEDHIGSIYIESNLEELNTYIHKQAIVTLLVTLAVLFVSYFLALGLQHRISWPVLSLASTAREISANKDYSVRAHPYGDKPPGYRDEIVILTESFNHMLGEISARDKQLKKQYAELERARDAAEAANRAKSQFLANISHELRTPLNAIIGFSSILMNQLFGPLGDNKYFDYAKDINESGTHLLDIINDILDLAKAEAGKLAMNFEEVHVGKAINKCVMILSERAEKNKITITTDLPRNLPPLVADRLRLIQVVLNILSNAIKFTPEGGKVHVSVRSDSTDGEVTHFIITIADTGIGMTQEHIDMAFQSFGQVDSGLDRRYEGTGLGLPLTKKLMELHFGTVEIQSELEKGTTVTLIFPALPPEANLDDDF